MSALLAEFRAFTEGAPPAPAQLVAYIAARFGAQHHLTSLVRYAVRDGEPASTGSARAVARSAKLGHARPLERGLHPCSSRKPRAVGPRRGQALTAAGAERST